MIWEVSIGALQVVVGRQDRVDRVESKFFVDVVSALVLSCLGPHRLEGP